MFSQSKLGIILNFNSKTNVSCFSDSHIRRQSEEVGQEW